jgi:hypothetical protein
MKIAVGVWGSSIRFGARTERWSGQSEYILFIEYLLKHPDVEEVVLLGKNDGKYVHYPDEMYEKITDCSLNPKKIYDADFAYIFQSQGAACISTIPGYRWVPNPWRRTKVLAMAANYAAPITDYLNRTNIPWAYLATDVRYIDMIKPADITNHPTVVLSQLECTIPKWKHAIKYLPYNKSDQLEYKVWTDIPVIYARLQKLNLFDGDLHVPVSRRRLHDFAIVANKILDFKYRSLEVAKWLPKGGLLFGNLPVSGYTNQFLPSDQLDEFFRRVRYTLVMPLYNHGHGKKWLTFKPYEMICNGVIPFCHPDYDQDGRFVSTLEPLSGYLRVTNPKELKSKMQYLDKHNDYRLEILTYLQKKLVPPTDLINYAKQLGRKFKPN